MTEPARTFPRAPDPGIPLPVLSASAEPDSEPAASGKPARGGNAAVAVFPTARQIGWFLFLSSLALYLTTLSWVPFPGLPVHTLLLHLGVDAAPAVLDPTWGRVIRMCARLPGFSAAGWAALFSALCGAACVGLTGCLMVRVRYFVGDEPLPGAGVREARARQLSGLVSGLYLACCIPFWTVATRSLPATFHVLLLLLAVWCFSEYQRGGRARHLALLGLVYGFGFAEFATFFVFLPLALFLVGREWLRWRRPGFWKAVLAIGGGLTLGLLWYPFNVLVLFRSGAPAGLFSSPWQAWGRILQEQAWLILQLPNLNPGVFVYVMFFSLATWLLLFTMSHRSPWFYSASQVLLRVILLAGLLAALFDAVFSPWRILGMNQLLVTPYLILAICTGYMIGEYWVLGQPQPLLDTVYARRWVRRARRLSAGFALVMPAIVLAGGLRNWRVADGRYGRLMESAAAEILGRMNGRDLLFSPGVMDDVLRWTIWQQRLPIQLVRFQQADSPEYLQRLAGWFDDGALQQPLLQGDFHAFMVALMQSADGIGRTAFIDLADLFREYGFLVPDGFVYRLEPSADRVNLPELVETQRAFWDRMERTRREAPPGANLIRPYQDLLLQLASKMANNLGFLQAERGDETGALETWRIARRIYPDNLSARLNLMELARSRELEEAEAGPADEAFWNNLPAEQRWTLSFQYGYVWRAREWVRRGWVWVISGAPATAEGARKDPLYSLEQESERVKLIDQVYLQWGLPFHDETFWRMRMMQNGRDTDALMALCRLSLRRYDSEAAEAYIAAALDTGLREDSVRFDRAMLAVVRGDLAQALDALHALARQSYGDARVWMALARLSPEGDPVMELAIKNLKRIASRQLGVQLALADVLMERQRLPEAQALLEQAVLLDSSNLQAWEMLGTLAQEQGNSNLMGLSLRALLARNPDHYLKYQNIGITHYQQGDLAAAEAAFRDGIQRKRDPILLNNLATIIQERGGDLQEALALADEALRRQPGHPGILSTRGEILLDMERFDAARRDFQQALNKRRRDTRLLLLLARSYLGLGEFQPAGAIVRSLSKQEDRLPSGQQQQLDSLRRQLP